MQVVSVTELLILEDKTEHPHGLNAEMFNALFTPDQPAIINFHGYPSSVKRLLFGRSHTGRFHINDHREEGATTTNNLHIRNRTSRYHLIMQTIRLASTLNPHVAARLRLVCITTNISRRITSVSFKRTATIQLRFLIGSSVRKKPVVIYILANQ